MLSKVRKLNWYLIQTKPNAHSKACDHLKRQGFKVFLPTISTTKKKGDKFVNKLSPLFPGYLFLGMPSDNFTWRAINATRGVYRAVTLDGKYRALDSQIISAIQLRCDKRDVIQDIDKIKAGDRVKIEKGPFAEFICKVDRIEDNKRVWVLISLLQQQTRAQIHLGDLSKIS